MRPSKHYDICAQIQQDGQKREARLHASIAEMQQALDMLAGLHPCLTTDDPAEMAKQIFDAVMSERAAHAQELANHARNLEARDALIARWRAGMRELIPEGKADDLNFVLFSTSGVHGSYCSIEDAEAEPALGVTFLIVQPRIVGVRYGNCEPRTTEDFAFLKALRASSREAVASIGGGPLPSPGSAPDNSKEKV